LIAETLESLQGISRAEAPAFFYTRLQGRLQKGFSRENAWSWVSKPAFSIATLVLLVVLNIAAIAGYLKKGQQTVEQTSGIQGFAKEYDLDASSVYGEKTSR
jgi:hypothetical protein